jgi:sulfide:quinone oxidoreductase
MTQSPLRVVIAGGGVAGLETLAALRALAGPRVELTLVAPDHDFVYRPVAVEEPFAVGRLRQIPLIEAARHAGAAFGAGMIEGVDPDEKIARFSEGRRLSYDALVLAVGATAEPAVDHAITWNDRFDSETVGGLLEDFDQGYSRRLAIVIPPGPAWPLRAYELALFITLEAKSMSIDAETMLVTPRPSPIGVLGSRAVEFVSEELEHAGIAVASAADVHIEPGHAATVVLQPSGERLEVDHVIALPALHGRPIAGIPANAEGFIDVDEHCRVRGLDQVWAVGDCTSFRLKSGGVASEHADVAAEDIAAIAGADLEPHPFDPVHHEELGGLPAGKFMNAWLVEDGAALTMHAPFVGLPMLTYLRRDFEAGWRGDL